MLEVRNETMRINPAPWNLNLSRARKRKPLMAEKITFVGFLYERPTQNHSQETAEGWLVRVSGAKDVPNGVYSIEVWEDQSPMRVFASAARLLTGLPERVNPTGYYPSFGVNEISLSTETYNLKRPTGLFRKLSKCFRESNTDIKYSYV